MSMNSSSGWFVFEPICQRRIIQESPAPGVMKDIILQIRSVSNLCLCEPDHPFLSHVDNIILCEYYS